MSTNIHNQANFSQVVLTPSRPASNTVTETSSLNQSLRLAGLIPTRPTMTLNRSLRAPHMTAIPNSRLQFITSIDGRIRLQIPLTRQTTPTNTRVTSSQPSQMSANTAKFKCKIFLSTLMRLCKNQHKRTAIYVQYLIQCLIDGVIEPDEFTNRLLSEFNSSPQPCLLPFLKKSLPYLRYSLMVHEMSIDGVQPPPPGSVQLPLQSQSLSQNTFQLSSQPRQTSIRDDDQVDLMMQSIIDQFQRLNHLDN